MMYAPNTYWEATVADRLEVCNGCGAKGGIKVPNTMWGLDLESDQVVKIAKVLSDEEEFASIVHSEYLSKL